MQVWGGFGLVVLFLLLFGINCWVWHNTKINYTFIFEFDTRHNLDYRQYLEVCPHLIWLTKLPSLLAFLGCFFFWLTFNNFWPDQLNAVWYPLIFLSIGIGILLFPFRTLHRSSRAWFAIANVRLLVSSWFSSVFYSPVYIQSNFATFSSATNTIHLFTPLPIHRYSFVRMRGIGFRVNWRNVLRVIRACWGFVAPYQRYGVFYNVFVDTGILDMHSRIWSMQESILRRYSCIPCSVYGALKAMEDMKLCLLFSQLSIRYIAVRFLKSVPDYSVLGYTYGLVVDAASCTTPFPPSRSWL
jgi:hypothetical protein